MKAQERKELLRALEACFERNMRRHKGITWADVRTRLEGNLDALRSVGEMEATGGEPDIIGRDKSSGHYVVCDCSAESPAGRRSVCYDRQALDSRKEHKPEGSAVEMAAAMGIDLLTEEQYRDLQKLASYLRVRISPAPTARAAAPGSPFLGRRLTWLPHRPDVTHLA